ncbi:carbohydrate-binding module family 1 protein [Stemphylium lycopersici]|uniref:Carbohydrate-binding module family 1 protein n=1 Tax=Stemphylium lycopersici TaxID=183478 RepID=A0A364MUX0_STELY|nr:carbohydrate-binding module family 1 protein [Stemphylium lycopersici]RAR04032.1 carbohydrate-binding module family 1 protein [Stemphylium lycopersici]
MKGSSVVKAASLLFSLFIPSAFAQETFTHEGTGIQFWRQVVSDAQTSGGFEWGMALPGEPTGANDEYIGYIKGSLEANRQGWSGISHNGGMPNSLLLVAWPEMDQVKTKFVWAPGYVTPEDYTGDATLSQIFHSVSDTHFEIIYRCQRCWVWNQEGAEGSQLPTGEVQIVGWAQHNEIFSGTWVFHNKGQGIFGAQVAPARNAKYSEWTELTGGQPSGAPTPTKSGQPSATPTTTRASCVGTPAPTGSYDYIVVGGGAGGIPVADKLSESGKSVLMLEKGPPSLARFGGTMGPEWATSNNLTRFDIPGLCNQIWVDSAGVACTDIDQMAGCVLGGGAAVNAALWWKPIDIDFDYQFPAGWKSSDVKGAIDRVFKRIPGTDTPSMDGKRYKQEGYDVLSGALSADGWKNVVANNQQNEKNRTYSHSPFMYENGQRQGPLGTYMVSALKRQNFKLWTNTMARRIVRSGGAATGVELESGVGGGGYCGTVNLNPGGRVILSGGAFGSSKVLFRSGIGPKDQLNVVKSSARDGATMIGESDWINLPVGKNLNDHVNTDLVIKHPNISFYDFYQAWDDPIEADKNLYLDKRSGILATSAPNIGPLAWEMIKGSDGIDRSIQWTARVEGPGANNTHHLTISQYLGHGSTSRGALSINGALNVVVSDSPYLKNEADTSVVIAGIKSMIKAIKKNPAIEFQVPPEGTTVEDYVSSLPKTPAARRANHWIGTAKLGTDSGLTGGTSVVDLNTQVYGTENIHVVDASIFPGHIFTNPTSYIVVIAEHAAAKILALGASNGGGKPSSIQSSSATAKPTTSKASSTSAAPTKTSAKPTTVSTSVKPTGSALAQAWTQCGGSGYTGPKTCVSGYKCTVENQWFSQCKPS